MGVQVEPEYALQLRRGHSQFSCPILALIYGTDKLLIYQG
jgi:hypothetical protein